MPGRIAIDGPAGAGKSTVGEHLARRLGYLYCDTGAMYRAVAWLALHRGMDLNNGAALGELAEKADIVISKPQIADGRQYTVTVHGRDITWDIRTSQVGRAVSTVAGHPEVRRVLIQQQRAIASKGQIVMVGRDIGSIVLPDAELKLYLTASLHERARRRYAEMVERMGEHNPALPSFEEVMQDVEKRDQDDQANMRPAPDAIIVDTDHLNIEQVLDTICQYVEEKV
ncbi:cytidylate kinase [Thermosporothrix hazakensis]|uniref:Cytidylate kinase n=1 Tax=Thermosporothrix hazakensis TaxID=644383 RepID=A0A326TYX5_THEHA|nr:(d)CMP kinase [Thermosporothrix hazakensis]PZW22550.1 cytidylate kinase [Thermosporothrix hazakensis]GCE48523.1 cytidylate kinase [Thermosporothrix hazakensis]